VPPAWERCKRCDADLADARARELVGAGATRSVTPAHPHAHSVPSAATPPPATKSCTRPALPFDPVAPLDVRASYERVPTAGESWAAATAKPSTRKLPIVGLLLAVLIGGSIWFAWKQATARTVPDGLKGYVHDGEGVEYSSPIGRFSVTLPTTPLETSESFVVSGAPMMISAVVSVVEEHAVGVLWFDAPPELVSTNDMNAALQQFAEGYAVSDGQVVVELDYVDAGGYPAVDATVESAAVSGKVRVVLVAQRVYVLAAGGTDGGAAGFDTLVGSFTTTPV